MPSGPLDSPTPIGQTVLRLVAPSVATVSLLDLVWSLGLLENNLTPRTPRATLNISPYMKPHMKSSSLGNFLMVSCSVQWILPLYIVIAIPHDN